MVKTINAENIIADFVGEKINIKEVRNHLKEFGLLDEYSIKGKRGDWHRLFFFQDKALYFCFKQINLVADAKEIALEKAMEIKEADTVEAFYREEQPKEEEKEMEQKKEFGRIESKEQAVYMLAVLGRFLKKGKGRSLVGLGSILQAFPSCRKVQMKDQKGRRFIFVQVDGYYRTGKHAFVVIEKGGVILSTRFASVGEFAEAQKQEALFRTGKNKREHARKLYEAFAGAPSGTGRVPSRGASDVPSAGVASVVEESPEQAGPSSLGVERFKALVQGQSIVG